MRFVDSGRLKVLSVCVEGKTDVWKNGYTPRGVMHVMRAGYIRRSVVRDSGTSGAFVA